MRNKSIHNYSDEEIVAGIRIGGIQRQRMTDYLYTRHMDFVGKGRRKYRITEEEAVDAYGDAIIGLCNRIALDAFQSEGNLSGYLYRAFSNRCVDRIRKNTSSISEQVALLPYMRTDSKTVLLQLIEKEDLARLTAIMEKMGGKCRQILIDSEYYGFSPEELTEKLGFKNTNSLASQKHRCLQKLRQLLEKRKDQII
ncbi:MAG: sigma-70 family RNA polymerase sigma factor [Bacteroidia bacterium]